MLETDHEERIEQFASSQMRELTDAAEQMERRSSLKRSFGPNRCDSAEKVGSGYGISSVLFGVRGGIW